VAHFLEHSLELLSSLLTCDDTNSLQSYTMLSMTNQSSSVKDLGGSPVVPLLLCKGDRDDGSCFRTKISKAGMKGSCESSMVGGKKGYGLLRVGVDDLAVCRSEGLRVCRERERDSTCCVVALRSSWTALGTDIVAGSRD
jgi:hypothetical protein